VLNIGEEKREFKKIAPRPMLAITKVVARRISKTRIQGVEDSRIRVK
jgi:hypothetical protein